MVYLWGLTLIFAKSWHLVEHSWFKYFMVQSVKPLNFDLMHYIYFSQFVFDEFIVKGGENVHKVVELLLTEWLREVCEKYDKFYRRRRACIEKDRGSVEFFFAISFHVCRFLTNSWVLRLCLSRWPFLSFSLVFGHLVVLQLNLNPKLKLCAFGVVNILIKREIEKPSGLCLGLFVWWVIDLL
jgi:hypothetical protein